MARLFTFFLLFSSLLGIFQQRALSCEQDQDLGLSTEAIVHNEYAVASTSQHETETNSGEDCECLAWECQNCQRCHRSLAIVAFLFVVPPLDSSPDFFGLVPSHGNGQSFTYILLDPPRIS